MGESGDGRPSVLVVDDAPLVADTIAAIFAHHGWEAHAVYGARSAAQIALLRGFDLLVTEISLPDGEQGRVAEEFLELYPQAHALLLGADTSIDGAYERARTAGRFESIAKPVAPDDLVSTARRLLAPRRKEPNRVELQEQPLALTGARAAC